LLGGFHNREITKNSVPAQAHSLRPKYLATRLHAPVRQTLEDYAAPIDFGKINHAVLAAFPAVLARVLPSGKQDHREWVALNPRRVDRSLGSFKVNRFNGKWCDFATGDKGGDPISLVAYVEGITLGEGREGRQQPRPRISCPVRPNRAILLRAAQQEASNQRSWRTGSRWAK
jgi:hypothetical protein